MRGDTRKRTLNSLGEIQPSVNLNQITNVDAARQLWTLIKQADVSRHVICASTKDLEGIKNEYRAEFQEWRLNYRKEQEAKGTKDFKEKAAELFPVEYFGLYPSFCYTVIGVAEYSGETLVRLRNPKGVLEWKGDWGDLSEKWKTIAPEFRPEVKDDGIFYMPFHEFANFFNDVTINYYEDSFIHTAFKDRIYRSDINMYEVVISTPGEYYFQISQKDKRLKGVTGGSNCKSQTTNS